MQILITNDDGNSSKAMHALAEKLSLHHEVIVVAPEFEQSGVGHAFSYKKNIKVKELNEYNYRCVTVDGTPADCIKFAFFELLHKKAPALLISGINDGNNTGIGCFYSGTVGGAREGVLLGIPSIAVSAYNHSEKNIEASIAWVMDLIDSGTLSKLSTDILWNINFPNVDKRPIIGTKFSAMSTVMYDDIYTLENKYEYAEYSFRGSRPEEDYIEGTDDHAVLHGYVSIVPIKTNQTDESFLKIHTEF